MLKILPIMLNIMPMTTAIMPQCVYMIVLFLMTRLVYVVRLQIKFYLLF